MANLRVKKKHINPDAIDGTKLKLLAGEAVRVVDAEGDTVELVKLDASGNVLGNGFELAKKQDLDAEVTSRQVALSAEESARIAGDAAEQSRALAAEAALQSAIDAETTSRQAAIADLVNSAPAVLDTLKELADALGGDEDFATTIANRFSSIESSLSAATQDGTEYTDEKHQEIELVSSAYPYKRLWRWNGYRWRVKGRQSPERLPMMAAWLLVMLSGWTLLALRSPLTLSLILGIIIAGTLLCFFVYVLWLLYRR